VLTRGLFFLSEREIPIPAWAAPGPALRATGGAGSGGGARGRDDAGPPHRHLARRTPVRRAAGAAWFWWRRDILGTILTGMAVLLPLRLGLGW